MFTAVSKKRLVSELGLTPEQAKQCRAIWSTMTRSQVRVLAENLGVKTHHGFVECWSYFRALVISAYLGNGGQNGFFGLEYLGENRRSGFDVLYLNTGDTYTATLIFHNGTMRLDCCGSLVESGSIRWNEK